MIDPSSEHLVSLLEAAKHLPKRREGKRPHVSCLYRWTTSGCKGVVLESLQIGGTRCTSREALSRFFARLSGKNIDAHATRNSNNGRERRINAAARSLESL